MKTLAFTCVIIFLLCLIMTHAFMRLALKHERQIETNSSQINALIEQSARDAQQQYQ